MDCLLISGMALIKKVLLFIKFCEEIKMPYDLAASLVHHLGNNGKVILCQRQIIPAIEFRHSLL